MTKITYTDYVKQMLSEGWKLNKKVLTEKDSNVKTFSYENAKYNPVVVIQCPSENIMSLHGNELKDTEEIKPHTIKLKLANKHGIEIPLDTIIRITKESNDDIIQYERIKYCDIKKSYQFKYTFELGRWSYDSIYIYVVVSNTDISLDIDKDKTKLNLEVDVWSK